MVSPVQSQAGAEIPPYTNIRAIQICQEKYPDIYKKKRLLTLAIVIGTLALFIIPLIVMGLGALSLCSTGVGVLIVTPIALLAIGILVKKIDDITLYWSGNTARLIIDIKQNEAEEAAKKEAAAQKKEEESKKAVENVKNDEIQNNPDNII